MALNVEQRLRAARDGSPDALGEILQAYRSYLLKIAREEIHRTLQPKGSASDIVQETFLEAVRDFEHFHGESAGELRAWLRCVLLRRAAKHGRRFRKTSKRQLDHECSLEPFLTSGSSACADAALLGANSTPSQHMAAEEEFHLLNQALEHLSGDHRRVMQLRYKEGRSFEEIASLMGRTANAVRLVWLRALDRVRHVLGTDGNG